MLADFLEVSAEVTKTSTKLSDKSAYDCIKEILTNWLDRAGNSATMNVLKENLEEMGLTQAVETLETICISDETPTTSQRPKYRPINILDPVPNFTGRETELLTIKEWYEFKSSSKHVLLVSAMGGQGKTELARKFLQTNEIKRHCAWMSGDGLEAFTDSLKKILNEVCSRKDRKEFTFEQLLEEFNDNLKIKLNEWLLIVDNVDTVFNEFEKFVGFATTHKAIFIVTGRPLDVFLGECELLTLDILLLEDAKNLVCKYLGSEESTEGLENLCYILGCHALALCQAASYVRAQRQLRKSYTILEYIEEFTTMSLRNPLKLHSNMYDQTFCSVVRLSTNAAMSQPSICPKCVKGTLSILALGDSHGMEKKNLFDLFDDLDHKLEGDIKTGLECPLMVKAALEILKVKVSLLREDEDWLSVHRLVRSVILGTIKLDWFAHKMLNKHSILLYYPYLIPLEFTNRQFLQSLWLRIDNPAIIENHSWFPVMLGMAEFKPDEKFLRDCLKNLRKSSSEACTFNILVLLDFAKKEFSFNEVQLFNILKKVKNEVKVKGCFDLPVLKLFFKSIDINLHLKLKKVLLILIEKEQDCKNGLKLKLFLVHNLLIQQKIKEAVCICEQFDLLLFSRIDENIFSQLLSIFNRLSFFQKSYFKKGDKILFFVFADLFGNIIFRSIGKWGQPLHKGFLQFFAYKFCQLWDPPIVLQKIEEFVYDKSREDVVSKTNIDGKIVHAFSVALTNKSECSEANSLLGRYLVLQEEKFGVYHPYCYITKGLISKNLLLQNDFEKGLFGLKKTAKYFRSHMNPKSWEILRKMWLLMISINLRTVSNPELRKLLNTNLDGLEIKLQQESVMMICELVDCSTDFRGRVSRDLRYIRLCLNELNRKDYKTLHYLVRHNDDVSFESLFSIPNWFMPY